MNSMAENPSDSANEREYRRESKACFCLLAIVIFILMMIFNKDLCINSENGLYFDAFKKICDNQTFLDHHYQSSSLCCDHIYKSICEFKTYVAKPDVKEACTVYRNFDNFLEFCVKNITVHDYHRLFVDYYRELRYKKAKIC